MNSLRRRTDHLVFPTKIITPLPTGCTAMALSDLNIAGTDSQDYMITFPETLRKDLGFTFPKVTKTTSETFSVESELFMGSPATLTIQDNVITRMAPGIIRDIICQFVDGSGDRVLPLTSHRAIPFDILMVNDKTREVFRMQPGSGPARALNSKERTDRDAIHAFFEYRSLLPLVNKTVSLDTDVRPRFPEPHVGDLFTRVTTSEDFTMPSTWNPEKWTSFVVTCRLGDSSQKCITHDEPGFNAFLKYKFDSTFYDKMGEVRGTADAPKYNPPDNADLSKWIEFVLHVRDPDWNALYMRRIGLVFYMIGARLLVFIVDKNINMISCMCTSADVIKYNSDSDTASVVDKDSLKTMLKAAMGSLLDQHVLDNYDLDTGHRMIGGWQSAPNTANTLPKLSEVWPDSTDPNLNELGIDNNLAQNGFERVKKWMSDAGNDDIMADGTITSLGQYGVNLEIGLEQGNFQTALLVLLSRMAEQLKKTRDTGGEGSRSLQAVVDAAAAQLNKSKPKTPGFTHWSKELKEASDRLASNASRIAVVDQRIIAAQAFKKSIDNDDKQKYQDDAANALRNALIDVDPVPHSTQIQGLQSAEGISVILLLHAFLMYFFDIRGVRSPGRNWDAVKPKSAQHVSRMFMSLLDIPA